MGLFDSLRGIESITVAKAYCVPGRLIISGIFQKYGVKIHSIDERLYKVKGIPALHVATVRVGKKQAVWAEYLLLCSNKFMLWSKPKNKRNEEWASKHKLMPKCWNGKPMIEKNCKGIGRKND